MMLLLISIIYIVAHSVCAWRRLEPVLRAIGDGYDVKVRVSIGFCVGTFVASVAWAYVMSVILEGLYV